MSVINTNMSSIIATNAIVANDRDQQRAMERLSTGLRINSAGDDAAGLAISERMSAEVSGLQMANRNANDAISMLETAEGATQEIVSMFQRMRELAVQAATDTYALTDRLALDLEFGELMNEIQSIATNTTWNTITILDGGGETVRLNTTKSSLTIQLGKAAAQNTLLSLASWDPAATLDRNYSPARAVRAGFAANTAVASDGADQWVATAGATIANGSSNNAYGQAILFHGGDDGAVGGADTAGGALNADKRIDITTRADATFALTQLDLAITSASSERAQYGAYIRRMEHTGNNLTNVARHQESSRSRIADADYAVETTELSRTTIIAQASTAMLAQANAAKQTVLTLLQ